MRFCSWQIEYLNCYILRGTKLSNHFEMSKSCNAELPTGKCFPNYKYGKTDSFSLSGHFETQVMDQLHVFDRNSFTQLACFQKIFEIKKMRVSI